MGTNTHTPATESARMSPGRAMFSTFDVTRQVFFRSTLSLGIVNLKPLQPGHVLLLPRRVVPRLSDLTLDEASDLFVAVRVVAKTLENVYKASALTIGLQDGVDAGQSVPHVHIHIIPRRRADYSDNDEIYPAMESNEMQLKGNLERANKENGINGSRWDVPKDEERKPRTEEEMEEEARWLGSFFEAHRPSGT